MSSPDRTVRTQSTTTLSPLGEYLLLAAATLLLAASASMVLLPA